MKIRSLCFLLLGFYYTSCAQITIQFSPVLNYSEIESKDDVKVFNGDSVRFTTIKFYISNVRIIKNDSIVFVEEKSYHLIDALDKSSRAIQLAQIQSNFDSLSFDVGIDSLTNVSGALDGDLDPTLGMYWTWQSGYINLKLEGSYAPLTTRNHKFAYHLGGYLPPFQTVQNVSFSLIKKSTIIIEVSVDKLLNIININEINKIMSPGEKAKEISARVPEIFSLK